MFSNWHFCFDIHLFLQTLSLWMVVYKQYSLRYQWRNSQVIFQDGSLLKAGSHSRVSHIRYASVKSRHHSLFEIYWLVWVYTAFKSQGRLVSLSLHSSSWNLAQSQLHINFNLYFLTLHWIYNIPFFIGSQNLVQWQ